MIGIINYGAGNIRSVYTSFVTCGKESFLIETAGDFKKADMVVLPGVGAFGDGMKMLSLKGMIGTLIEEVNKGKPFLGICLGLQMLFSYSEEGETEGLGIIKGKVERFKVTDKCLKVPHMGWSQVTLLDKNNPIFYNIGDSQYFYFAHSFYVVPDEPSVIAGTTSYGVEFASFVSKKNIVGVQFHPEKSGRNGIQFLKNFLEGKWLR
ncbi:MAG: imidazole glycerol phosphate synthase subunit HisH [Candidatus Ratteibacteria bacterium]|nr:imidazole glycerol phosphate synthase subunit HisH [Candidatus Ratteibacteria bacterium]